MLDGEEGSFAFDGYSVSFAFVRPIVPHGEMLCASVVPERDGIFTPVEADLKLWAFAVLEHKAQQRWAFSIRHAFDRRRERAIDMERRLPDTGWVRTIGCSALGYTVPASSTPRPV